MPDDNIYLQPLFHPDESPNGVDAYYQYIAIRGRIISVVREPTPQKDRVIDEIADAIFEADQGLPKDIISTVLSIIKFGKTYREKKKRKEIFRKVVNAILEQIFDPGLRFKMTRKDILDSFEACGFDRERVTTQQIGQIYARVLYKLRVGEIRDLTYETDLYPYVRMKIDEIQFSRQDWELNGR